MFKQKNVSKEIKRIVQVKTCQIPRENRTLTALTKLGGRVYIYCGDWKTQQHSSKMQRTSISIMGMACHYWKGSQNSSWR